jgi:crossover junction endodeoxyribonuclease RuvC
MSSSLIVGIDPGLSGAIAFFEPASGKLHVDDMPTSKSPTGKNEVDLRELGRLLAPIQGEPGPRLGVLEKVSARPSDGVAGAFSFGMGYGALRMAIIGLGYEDRYVTPAAWKKHFKLNADKGISRAYASTRFPHHADLFRRVKDDGRAEAALIALYGAEVLRRPTA